MKTHKLKTLPEYFNAQLNGMKKFEIRKNDRGFQCFDTIILQEWDGEKYTGRKMKSGSPTFLDMILKALSKGLLSLGLRTFSAFNAILSRQPMTKLEARH